MIFCNGASCVAWLPDHSLVLVSLDKTLQPSLALHNSISFLVESFNLDWNKPPSSSVVVTTFFYPAF
jgi:hypothetical protein